MSELQVLLYTLLSLLRLNFLFLSFQLTVRLDLFFFVVRNLLWQLEIPLSFLGILLFQLGCFFLLLQALVVNVDLPILTTWLYFKLDFKVVFQTPQELNPIERKKRIDKKPWNMFEKITYQVELVLDLNKWLLNTV